MYNIQVKYMGMNKIYVHIIHVGENKLIIFRTEFHGRSPD